MVLQNNVQIPDEGVKLQVQNTRLFIESHDYGKGTLCISESNLVWKLDNGDGLCLDYPNIALHAVSSDLNAFPHECLYVMLDNNITKRDSSMDEENEDGGYENDDEEGECTELRFVPDDKAILNTLFLAMNDCQALHPDQDQSDSDKEPSEEEGEEGGEEDDNEEYTDVPDLQIIGTPIFRRMPEGENHNENGGMVINSNGDHHQSDNDQFEDAD